MKHAGSALTDTISTRPVLIAALALTIGALSSASQAQAQSTA